MPEKVVGIIENLRSRDLTRYSVVFTDRRIIVAKAENLKKALSALFAGLSIGFLNSSKYWARKATLNRVQRSDDMVNEKIRNSNPDSILRMDKQNFSIPYGDLRKIEMKLSDGFIYVSISSNCKEYEYHLPEADASKKTTSREAFNAYVKMIKQVVPDKIIIKSD